MKPEERKALVASGVFRADDPSDATPLLDRHRVNDTRTDFRECHGEAEFDEMDRLRPLAKPDHNPTVTAVLKAEEGAGAIKEELDMATFRLRAMLTFLLDALTKSSDPMMRLHADVIRIVVGEGNPPRMTELAARHGITRSAVSLRCRKLLRQLGLEPSAFMRPEGDVTSMRFSRIMSHITQKPVSVGGKRRKSALFLDFQPTTPSPGKESIEKRGIFATRARPREISTNKGKTPNPVGSPRQPS